MVRRLVAPAASLKRGTLGEDTIRARLRSHLVPYDVLNVGGYAEINDLDAREAKVRHDFSSFLLGCAKVHTSGDMGTVR